MARQLEAVFEDGILRPLESLHLAEHQRVRLTLEEEPLVWHSTERANERREEMRWLAEEARDYAGQWVALDGFRLIAHGQRLSEVSRAAAAAGATEPLFAHVPAVEDLPFAGW